MLTSYHLAFASVLSCFLFLYHVQSRTKIRRQKLNIHSSYNKSGIVVRPVLYFLKILECIAALN